MFHSPDGEYMADIDHHPDMASLADAVAAGCLICVPMMQKLLRRAQSIGRSMPETFQYGLYPDFVPRFSIYELGGNSMASNKFITHLIGVPKSKISANLRVGRRKAGLSFPEASERALGWMKNCLGSHNSCKQNQIPTVYPSRLIELRDFDMCLISPTKDKTSGAFVALSYCWGHNPNFLRLTVANLPELSAGISYETLPIAFQEAMRLARSLTIKYIWIDSLCIIQSGPGSAEDWASESRKMKDVYSSCILNISMSSSSNPHDSCLSPLAPHVTYPFEVDTTKIISVTYGEHRDETCVVYDPQYFPEALNKLPLGQRAWALQERLLSPRVLSFGMGEIFWDCKELSNASEALPKGQHDQVVASESTVKTILRSNDPRSLQVEWMYVLDDYVSRELTFPNKDKMVALSAVVSQFEVAMDDVCVAGHFWKMLPDSLGWRIPRWSNDAAVVPTRMTSRMSDQYCSYGTAGGLYKVPRWSWASMHGPLDDLYVDLRSDFHDQLVPQVIAYHYTQLIDATGGDFTTVVLEIKAHSANVETGGDDSRIKSGIWDMSGHEVECQFDDISDMPSKSKSFVAIVLLHNRYYWRVEGLLLNRVSIDDVPYFERVGSFIVHNFEVGPGKHDTSKLFGNNMSLFRLI